MTEAHAAPSRQRQKPAPQQAEYERCQAIREDMPLLGIRYGQIDP